MITPAIFVINVMPPHKYGFNFFIGYFMKYYVKNDSSFVYNTSIYLNIPGFTKDFN